MKKLFESIFKSKSRLIYEPSATANEYANDLKMICDHFKPLICGEPENHDGFHYRFCALRSIRCENIRDLKEIMEMLVGMTSLTCRNMVGGNVDKKVHTINRIVNMKSVQNAVRNVIPSLCDRDLSSYSKIDHVIMFFVGTYKETPGITSGVAIVSFKLRLDIKDYFVSIDISEAIGYTYTDFRWISNHLARI
jgi:hypothetical protein